MPPTPIHGTKLVEMAKHCMQWCFGDEDGPGAKLKAQIDKWRGAFALGAWVAGIGMAMLAIAVTVGMALMPSLVRSAVATSSAQVVPGLVDSAVAAALKRHGLTEIKTEALPASVVVQAPRAPWLFSQAHAETKGTP